MATARNIITLALESMNRLAPGEAIDADLAASCLRRLNSINDDWGAGRAGVPQDQIIVATVSGVSFSLGTGSFAAISAGDEIISMMANTTPMSPITIQQYNEIPVKTTAGVPQFWAQDGLSTVFLYPAAASSVLSIVTRKPFASFADLDTVYLMPSGYEGAFAACLAVAMAPALIGKVTVDLMGFKREAMYNIQGGAVKPAIVSANPMMGGIGSNILSGFR